MPKGEKKAAPAKKAAKEKAPKEKKEKDPNAPKKPLGAYFFYQNEVRAKVKEENPDAKVTEIAKIIGEQWRELSDKEKEKFNKKAAADKERYEKESAAYKAK